MKVSKQLFLSGILTILCFSVSFGQSQHPYTEYMAENYPASLEAITAYMKEKNPNADQAKMEFLVEFQCKALETLLQAMNDEGASFNILYRSIESITESAASDRKSMDFWTWPKTDWVEVKNDYLFTLETQ